MAPKRDSYKIIFAGLDNSGKTSIIYALQDKFSMLNPAPTVGIERNTFEVLGFNVHVWDLGGQNKFRTSYLDGGRTFASTDLLFFILDLQERSRFGEASEYFDEILKTFFQSNEKPAIILCFHKIDPDLRGDERILSNLQVAKQLFRRKAAGFNFEMFETTIYEKWTLTAAFSKGLLKLSSKSNILDKQLEGLANQLQSETVLLLDESALLFGQYFKNQSCYDVCQLVSPHLAIMADRINKHGANFEVFQLKLSDGGWVFFRDISIENKRFYLILYNNQPESATTMDKTLSTFVQQVTNIIQTFFM
ncbi:MAG: ADP-ribosylation factor-like protein [Candidatus Helarchaeota archaeon]|nr:ADP-ribosylation factor-like protein [Candidatus Helarchaeota archaeon]